MLELEYDTVEKWLSDAQGFSYEFMRYCMRMYRACEVDITFDRPVIEAAHADWQSTVSHWRIHLFKRDTESLSYIKIFAILLWCLSRRPYVLQVSDYEIGDRRSEYHFNGDEAMRHEIVQDFLGAPEVICALDFCIAVIASYEENREDRQFAYEPRLTKSFRHDLIHILSTDDVTALQIYVMLEGLFTRP